MPADKTRHLNQPLLPAPNSPITSGTAIAPKGAHAVHKNQLATLNGVFVPCCLNIMGIILFIRMGWGVAQAGIIGTLLIIAVAEIMAILTVLSFSAIVTNGEMAGGGSYFMISRSLGPEFGGAMGMLFYAAYAMGVAFYIIGFATEVQSTWFADADAATANWIRIGIGSVGLLIILAISVIGADAFAKFNVWFFVIQFGAILIAIGSYVFSGESELTTKEYKECLFYCDADHIGEHYLGNSSASSGVIECTRELLNTCLDGNLTATRVTGMSLQNFEENLWWNFSDTRTGATQDVNAMCGGMSCTVTLVFSVLFPMATGIMEGANLSGDLKDPSRSIPKGTIYAIASAIVVYVAIVFTMGAAFPRSTLKTNMNVMQEACINKYVVVVGIIISTISSALGSLFGGSRVLQALARDDLFPVLKPFAKGTPNGDEPRRAVIFTWAVAQGCIFIGNLDSIAPLITSFFCMSYALCNLTAFALSVTGAPNFRPTWRYYSWHLSLAGFLMNIVIMFMLDWLYSLVCLMLLTALFLYVWWKHPATNWGDVSQALMYHQVRKYLLKIDETKSHTKFWRPSVLLFVDDYSATQIKGMVNFCRDIKKGGLMVLGSVIVGDLNDMMRSNHGDTPINERIRSGWSKYITDRGIKAFPQEVVAPNMRLGYQFLMQGTGIGGLRCNTIALPLFRNDDAEYDSSQPVTQNGDARRGEGGSYLSSGRTLTGQRSQSFYNDVADALAAGKASPNGRKGSASTNNEISVDVEGKPDGSSVAAAETEAEAAALSTSDSLNRFYRGQSMYGNVSSKVASRLENSTFGNLPVSGPDEYLNIIEDALMLRKNIVVGCNVAALSENYAEFYGAQTKRTGVKTSVDIWLTGEWSGHFGGSDAMVVQLGSILQGRRQWRGISQLRVMCLLNSSKESRESKSSRALSEGDTSKRLRSVEKSLRKQLYEARITDVTVKAISSDLNESRDVPEGDDWEYKRAERMNEIIKTHSGDAAMILMGMPARPTVAERTAKPGTGRRYLKNTEVMIRNLPATYLVIAGEQRDIITKDI